MFLSFVSIQSHLARIFLLAVFHQTSEFFLQPVPSLSIPPLLSFLLLLDHWGFLLLAHLVLTFVFLLLLPDLFFRIAMLDRHIIWKCRVKSWWKALKKGGTVVGIDERRWVRITEAVGIHTEIFSDEDLNYIINYNVNSIYQEVWSKLYELKTKELHGEGLDKPKRP